MKIEVYVETNLVGSRVTETVEIDDEDMVGMNDDERREHIEDIAREVVWNMAEWGWEEITPPSSSPSSGP
jgi:GTP cyclohydrolase FolE2